MGYSGLKWLKIHESGVENMFFGEYSYTLDSKGRLNIPSRFRDKLADP